MALTSSTEAAPSQPLTVEQRHTLLDVARRSIEHGLVSGRLPKVRPTDYHCDLMAVRASFVTLQRHHRLRGCIGHIEARRPLVADVAENAFAAAFHDPRFTPLTAGEWPEIDIHLSILTPAESLCFADEADLLRQIEPATDGLILQDGPHHGTFLPSVWENLPDPVDFVTQLKRKAGLPANHWSNTIQVARYRAESFGDRARTTGHPGRPA